jgi:hypothetical protein
MHGHRAPQTDFRGSTASRHRNEGSLRVGRASGCDADDLRILGEPTERLLGNGHTAVDADLKNTSAGPQQCHLRIWPDLADQVCRLTGARFIISLTAVLDFDAHRFAVRYSCDAAVVARAYRARPCAQPFRICHAAKMRVGSTPGLQCCRFQSSARQSPVLSRVSRGL